MERKIKIAYIGGGSKQWARTFMSDLAVAENLSGEIALYDIDMKAAELNARIGGYINQDPRTKSKFEYKLYERLEDSLNGADFVVISILPGTFKEMRSDVHAPEKYGIYQAVGDTVGPGGVLRAMRTVPIYENFAAKIREICPNARDKTALRSRPTPSLTATRASWICIGNTGLSRRRETVIWRSLCRICGI